MQLTLDARQDGARLHGALLVVAAAFDGVFDRDADDSDVDGAGDDAAVATQPGRDVAALRLWAQAATAVRKERVLCAMADKCARACVRLRVGDAVERAVGDRHDIVTQASGRSSCSR